MSLNIKNGDQLIPVAGTPKVTKSSLELDKVENKTSAEIRDELTLDNVKNAMGDAYLDKTELSSFKEEVYKQTGGKNMLGGSLVNKTNSQSNCGFVYDEMTSKLTINGKATATPTLVEFIKSKTFKAGSYTLSIHDVNNAPENMIITIRDTSNTIKYCADITPTSTSRTFTLSSDTVINISVRGDTSFTYDNTSCYIMLRKADTDDTFVPYMPTNQELQTNLLSTIVASSNASATNSKTLEFKGTGKNLEKLVVEGKTVQDGTPSPSAPVEVKGVGDKSRNLFKITVPGSSNGVTITPNADTGEVTFSGTSNSGASYSWSANLQLEAGTYTLIPNANRIFTVQIFKNSAYFSNHTNVGSSLTITLTEKASYSFRAYFSANTSANLITKPMLVKEGVSTEFELYYEGYKIPISSGGKSTNIYLNAPLFDGDKADVVSGVAEKKYGIKVFDGSESWEYRKTSGTNYNYFILNDIGVSNVKKNVPVTTNIVKGTSVEPAAENAYISSGGALAIFTQNAGDTADAFKEFLRSMNSSGNPVYMIYPLATPTKETFDGVEIPTSIGKNTLSVDTDVTPAKVEVTSFGEYYSKSEVDKMFNNTFVWNISELSDSYFENSDYLTQYYNQTTKRVVIVLKGILKKQIPANTLITLGYTTSNVSPPIGKVTIAYEHTDNSRKYRITKNEGNNTVILSNYGAAIPSGSEFVQQLEYTAL